MTEHSHLNGQAHGDPNPCCPRPCTRSKRHRNRPLAALRVGYLTRRVRALQHSMWADDELLMKDVHIALKNIQIDLEVLAKELRKLRSKPFEALRQRIED